MVDSAGHCGEVAGALEEAPEDGRAEARGVVITRCGHDAQVASKGADFRRIAGDGSQRIAGSGGVKGEAVGDFRRREKRGWPGGKAALDVVPDGLDAGRIAGADAAVGIAEAAAVQFGPEAEGAGGGAMRGG